MTRTKRSKNPVWVKDKGDTAATAKSLQSCPTLYDPRDCSPPGSPSLSSPGKNNGVGYYFLLQCIKVKSDREVTQSCPTLSDPMDCSLPGSSVHGICQARVLEWGATAFSRSVQFLSFIEPIFAWNVPLGSLIFLKRSLLFPILLFSSISLHWLLRKAFLSLLAILWNSDSNGYVYPFLLCFLLLFFSQLFVRPPQTATLLFCISFSWGWSWSLSPVQCHELLSIVHQALCLSDLVP